MKKSGESAWAVLLLLEGQHRTRWTSTASASLPGRDHFASEKISSVCIFILNHARQRPLCLATPGPC